MDIRTIIGDNLQGFRPQLEYTQETLAIRRGLHINYISSVERGERNIGVVNLSKIAKALKVKPSVLLEAESFRS